MRFGRQNRAANIFKSISCNAALDNSAPAMLLFGFSRTSGLPAIYGNHTDMTEVNELHRLANENDRAAKQRMKEEFDARMKAKEC